MKKYTKKDKITCTLLILVLTLQLGVILDEEIPNEVIGRPISLEPTRYDHEQPLFLASVLEKSPKAKLIVNDISSPLLDSPPDLIVDHSSVGNLITWNPKDNFPSKFEIKKNGTLVLSGVWSNDTAVQINVDGLPLGVFQYNILVNDTSGNSSSDTVLVFVTDLIDPIINSPSDITYEHSTLGHKIQWFISDQNPFTYTILQNGSIVDVGIWNSANPVIIPIDELSLGTYNFTIFAFDTSDNFVKDTVLVVVVDTIRPTVNHPINIAYKFRSVNNKISWTAKDSNPDNFIIYRNNSAFPPLPWNSSFPIIHNIDKLTIGHYNYTIVVFDAAGNSVVDMVFVTVEDLEIPPLNILWVTLAGLLFAMTIPNLISILRPNDEFE